MQLEIEDQARGWVKVGERFSPVALPSVVRGCDYLITHAQAVLRIREGERVVMRTEGGRWVKSPTTGSWRASGWCDLPGFEDTVDARR